MAAALAAADQAREQALANAGNATRQARQAVKVSVMANGHIDQVIEMRAAGVDAGYVDALRVAQPRLRDVDPASFAGMKSIGVTPEYARDLSRCRPSEPGRESAGRSAGDRPDRRLMRAHCCVPAFRSSLDDYVQLHAVGVPIRLHPRHSRSGDSVADPDKVIADVGRGCHAGTTSRWQSRRHAPRPPADRPPRWPRPPDGTSPTTADGHN